MKTLKEAITHAGNEADLVVEQVWAETFLASLESNGYCIVPMEATEEMLVDAANALTKHFADNKNIGDWRAVNGWTGVWLDKAKAKARIRWSAMLAVRPKLGD